MPSIRGPREAPPTHAMNRDGGGASGTVIGQSQRKLLSNLRSIVYKCSLYRNQSLDTLSNEPETVINFETNINQPLMGTNKMANLPLKWLFPRVLRAGKREKIASGSNFCPRGHLDPYICAAIRAYGNMTYVHSVKRFLQKQRLVGTCSVQTKSAPKHAPWKAGLRFSQKGDKYYETTHTHYIIVYYYKCLMNTLYALLVWFRVIRSLGLNK